MKYEISRLQGQPDVTVKTILDLLPEWFGIETAVKQYALDAKILPTFGVYFEDFCAGILTISYPSDECAEIHLLAVHPHYHRHGIGQHLVRFAEEHAKFNGKKFLAVKTLGDSHPDTFYQATRQFYSAVGFSPLMELSGVWESNPCLIMAKFLV